MKLLHSLALFALLSSAMPAAILAQDDRAPLPRPERPAEPGDAPETEGAAPELHDAEGEAPGDDAAPAPDPAPITRDLAGPFLAARASAFNNDFSASAQYFQRALRQDPTNLYLLDSALVAMIAAGDVEAAIKLSGAGGPAALPTPPTELLARASLAQREDWAGLVDLLDATRPAEDADIDGTQLLDGLIRVWALLGAGSASESAAALEQLDQIGPARELIAYHKGMTRAMVGDFEGALEVMPPDQPLPHLQGLLAQAQILALLERRDEAIALLEAQEITETEPALAGLLERLNAGEEIAFDVVRDARDGIAQVFLTFASILNIDAGSSALSLVHARLAAYVSPDLTDARLIVAQLLQDMGQFDAAETEFTALRAEGKMRPMAELARIDALSRAERKPEAEAAALALTEAYPDIPEGWIALGDIRRQQDSFAEAVPAYDRAIELIEDGTDAQWFPIYARGIAQERAGRFDLAEGDLRRALELRPEEPHVLNYLGYSYVDRNENLDEALDLIERAVELAPDDGYILDSLAWVYYRLGRYEEAVEPMEASVQVMPSDPLVNDHLGDIYWMVGRKREASVQWQRALSLEPETEEDAYRIRMKLERGLDAVKALEAEHGGTLPPPPPAPEDEDEDAPQ
ncbi:MAG: tetratricopeptide repeat protein [Paracoccus sp. (in: a-proteobacteria)]|nr:tetratricopeptide repeat protein [Paracoccus sp. (in: a-proteobacteria)]